MSSYFNSFITLLSILLFSDTQILHSVSRMDTALQNQATLAGHLHEYLKLEYKRLHQLELFMKQVRTAAANRRVNETELQEKLSNPINVLRLITELYTETENIRLSLQPADMSEVLKSALDSLPTNEDYTNALRSIIRLQHTYQEQADFTRPQPGVRNSVLTAMEVFEVAKTALDDGNAPMALENMKRAKEMFADEGDISNSMLSYDYLAYVMHEQGNTVYALNYTYELLDYYQHTEFDEEVVNRLNTNIQTYMEELEGVDKSKIEAMLSEPYKNEPDMVHHNYHELCRGERIQIDGITERKLSCYLQDNGDPRLLLAPARVEELSAEAGLSFYHNVLSDNEINLLRKLAAEKFEDSELVLNAEADTNATDKSNSRDYHVRSSNTGWVDDEEDDIILAISRRVSAMTGLDLSFAEPFQVLSYGVGGFYLPHYDYSHNDGKQVENVELPQRDRIATWIFYLNDVEKGGATVFPDLGATVWPEKGGAAFWYNLYKNGTGNTYTLHAACPVLQGYKWASNKWFHEGGNELARPCDLNEKL